MHAIADSFLGVPSAFQLDQLISYHSLINKSHTVKLALNIPAVITPWGTSGRPQNVYRPGAKYQNNTYTNAS